MSWKKAIIIKCDGKQCEETIQFEAPTINMAEIKARKKDWSSRGRGSDRENYCPNCKEDYK